MSKVMMSNVVAAQMALKNKRHVIVEFDLPDGTRSRQIVHQIPTRRVFETRDVRLNIAEVNAEFTSFDCIIKASQFKWRREDQEDAS